MKKTIPHYIGLGLFCLLSLIAVLATVIPLFHSNKWYIRLFDFPRLQTFLVALIAMIWFAVFYFQKTPRGFSILAALLAVTAVQAYKAFPYTPLGAKQVLWSATKGPDTTTHLSLFISNVKQSNNAFEKVIARIRAYRPDVVITTESNHKWQAGLSPIEKDYPYRVAVPQDNTYGMHLYSKLPLRGAEVRRLLEPQVPSIRTQVQLRSGQWIHLFVVHPRPPLSEENSDTRERDAEIILVGREARKKTGGVIVAGDFNDVAWSRTTELFQEVTGYLDPRRGRGFYNTFHAKIPIFRWPLDHIFHSSHFRLVAIERVDAVNSDHFPMYVRLSYEPSVKSRQPNVKKDENTRENANEAIRKGKNDQQ